MLRTHYDGDLLLTIRFTPEATRTHFRDSGDSSIILTEISDEALAEAARRVVTQDQQLGDAVYNVFELILDEASAIEAARRN